MGRGKRSSFRGASKMRTRNLEIPGSLASLTARNDNALPEPPANLLSKTLVELRLIGPFRHLPHALVEPMGVVTDQNAPVLRLDAIEDDPGRSGGRGRRILAKAAGAFGRYPLNILIRHF